MKRTLLYALSLAAILGTSSCSEKFDVAAPYRNVTVVNGFLDIRDTAHYIRIEKGFMDQNKSGLDMAKVPDSSYYSKLTVLVKELIPGNPVPVNTIVLKLVDLNNEGYPKDTGTFFTSPNYAYKFTEGLKPDHRYRLVITNQESGEVDSAETSIIDTAFSHFYIPALENPDYPLRMNIAKTINNKVKFSGSIVTAGTDPNAVPAGVKVMECTMLIYYRDSNSVAHTITPHILTWNNVPADITITSSGFDFALLNTTFYDFFKENIPATPDVHGLWRLLDSCDIIMYAGSSDYYTYRQVTGAQAGGLTGGEIKPNYSNIQGGLSLGLFTTRTAKTGHAIKFEVPESIDSLRVNPRTSNINFTVP